MSSYNSNYHSDISPDCDSKSDVTNHEKSDLSKFLDTQNCGSKILSSNDEINEKDTLESDSSNKIMNEKDTLELDSCNEIMNKKDTLKGDSSNEIMNEKDTQKVDSSNENMNEKDTLEVDSDDSIENIPEEKKLLAKVKVPQYLTKRFPGQKKVLKQFIKHKNKLKSPISFSEIQKKSEYFSNGNDHMENDAFFNSLPSHCQILQLNKPLKTKHTRVITYPLPFQRRCAMRAIRMILCEHDENLMIKETWKLFNYFVMKNYLRGRDHSRWNKYHNLFKTIHCELQLDGPLYRQRLQDCLKIIEKETNKTISTEIYSEVCGMYNTVADPPLNLLGSLLTLAWRYLKEKNFLCFGTVPEIKMAANFMHYKFALLNLEISLGKLGLYELMAYVDNESTCEDSAKSLRQDKGIENSKISNEIKILESSSDLKENQKKDENFSKCPKNFKNFPENIKSVKYLSENLSENETTVQNLFNNKGKKKNYMTKSTAPPNFGKQKYKVFEKQKMCSDLAQNQQTSESSHKNYLEDQNYNENLTGNTIFRIDESNIYDFPNVARIRSFYKDYDLKWKHTHIFPLPLSNIRTAALGELAVVFVKPDKVKIINKLENVVIFFTNANSGTNDHICWTNYHHISKLVYVVKKRGNGHTYFDRLQKSMNILKRGQFELIPQEIYDELAEAYKTFADSSYDEIGTLLILAKQYLEEQNVFIYNKNVARARKKAIPLADI